MIVAGGSLASADSTPGGCEGGKCPSRTVCFNVHCVYAEHDGSGPCQAAATFTKRVTGDGAETLDDSEPADDAQFEVECNDEVRFNGSAHRYTDQQGTRLQAVIGPYPAVLLPPHALRDGHRYELSALDLGKDRVRGFCYLYTGPQPR
jgi:hypothetical protein